MVLPAGLMVPQTMVPAPIRTIIAAAETMPADFCVMFLVADQAAAAPVPIRSQAAAAVLPPEAPAQAAATHQPENFKLQVNRFPVMDALKHPCISCVFC